jgi:hypothetical protein
MSAADDRTRFPPRMLRRRIALRIVVLCCAGVTLHGQSSGTIKAQILKSWLFQSADLFYPRGVAPDGANAYPALTTRELSSLEKTAQDHFRVVAQLHETYAPWFRQSLGSSVPLRIKGLVLLQNKGQPTARSIVNNKREMEIMLDVRVLQANFKSSLVAVAKSPSWFSDFDGRPRPSTATTDEELITEFLQFKAEIAAAPAGNSVGDLFNAFRTDLADNRALNLLEFGLKTQGIQNHYSGTLLFLMAHEAGHFILGHHGSRPAADTCEVFETQEENADAYATILLTAAYSPMGSMSRMVPLTSPSDLAGVDTFFDLAYERIGFQEQRNAGAACAYPSLTKRKQWAGVARDKTLEAIDRQLFTVQVK